MCDHVCMFRCACGCTSLRLRDCVYVVVLCVRVYVSGVFVCVVVVLCVRVYVSGVFVCVLLFYVYEFM